MLNRASVRIVRDAREWLSGRTGPDAADVDWAPDGDAVYCLEVLLEARENWLGSPDPTLWKSGDAHRLLIDTTAPRLTDMYRLSELSVTVLRVLVDFLDDTDRFHPASVRVAALRRELDRAAAKFPAAMADESVWRLAKRVFTAMRADGIDPADDTAIDEWAAEFSTAPADRRHAVLGVLLDRQPELLTAQFVIRDSQVAAIAPGTPIPPQLRRHDPDICPDCQQTPVNPPVALPPVKDLAEAARRSALLRTMLACGRWAGTGQRVTKAGFPPPAETRTLAAVLGVEVRDSIRDPRDHLTMARTWWLALDSEVLQLHRTIVIAGPALAALERAMADDADPEHTLRTWQDITDIAVTGPTPPAGRERSVRQLDEFNRPWGPRALGELYRIDEPAHLDDLVDTLVTDYHGPDADEILAMMIGASVRHGMRTGVEAGAITVTVPADAQIDAETDELVRRSSTTLGEPAWALASIPGTQVELTPLGRHLVRQNLLAEGSHAPLLEPAT